MSCFFSMTALKIIAPRGSIEANEFTIDTGARFSAAKMVYNARLLHTPTLT
nr:hypothetical protein [Natranaerofaba carboxydovora]